MFTKLLVPLDRSELAEQALGRARALARGCQAAVDIVMVHQPDEYAMYGDTLGLEHRQLDTEEQYLSDITTKLASPGSVSTTHAVLRGDVVPSLTARALEGGADLIVMTSHGRTGLRRAMLGSTTDGMIRHSAIPVMVLRPAEHHTSPLDTPEPFRTILVPLDGSPEALRVLDAATSLACCDNAQLILVRIVQPVPLVMADASIASVYPLYTPDDLATDGLVKEATRELEAAARTCAEKDCPNARHEVVVAMSVAPALLEFARDHRADAIAMSTHGRGASRLLIGSVADEVMRGSGLPMLMHGPTLIGRGAMSEHDSAVGAAPPLASIA
ncbi:MAG: universal stress protein [bacterium]